MRLWSFHPSYLDAKGLVALWREALLAKNVLAGWTRGYRHHPQLSRFRNVADPAGAINAYLFYVWREATGRGFNFNKRKIGPVARGPKLNVNRGQIRFEFGHLMKKLERRDPRRYAEIASVKTIRPHPAFRVVGGGVEGWEKGRAARPLVSAEIGRRRKAEVSIRQ